ncbi:unnamed protein product [Arctogadus glacialis]
MRTRTPCSSACELKPLKRREGLGPCSPLSRWFQAQPSITVRPPFKYRAPGPSRTDPVAQRWVTLRGPLDAGSGRRDGFTLH